MTLSLFERLSRGAAMVAAAVLAYTGSAQAPEPAAPQPAEPVETQYMRVVEKPGESLALEVAAWKFRPQEGEGPVVALVGVSHIGDALLYRNLQALLGKFDLVLYESVKPAGACTPRGESDEDRVEATRSSLQFLAQMIEVYEDEVDAYPATANDLRIGIAAVDPRLAQWTAEAMTDAWGNPVQYSRFTNGAAYEVISLGADGAAGGDDAAADISINSESQFPRHNLSEEDNLQAQLAEALYLEFQLEAMDYSADNWRCSDMTVDQLSRAFSQRGLDFEALGGTLAGSSLPARLVKMLLRAARWIDMLMEGVVSDAMKIMMIDLLGNDEITEAALNNQFGQGFAEVIIGERNQVVMDDLRGVMDDPEVNSVAIFYGAAHMPDFEKRLLEQFKYVPEEAVWIPAMTVSFTDSALSEEDIASIRRMVQASLKTMR